MSQQEEYLFASGFPRSDNDCCINTALSIFLIIGEQEILINKYKSLSDDDKKKDSNKLLIDTVDLISLEYTHLFKFKDDNYDFALHIGEYIKNKQSNEAFEQA